jgi:hypothetical protein
LFHQLLDAALCDAASWLEGDFADRREASVAATRDGRSRAR